MKKKWWIGIIVLIVVLVIGIPTIKVITIHNATYDCSYVKQDVNLETFISKELTHSIHYDSTNQSFKVVIEEDLLNTLLNDYLSTTNLELPKNFTLQEAKYSAKDQRLYVNGKYGNIFVPISAKININLKNDGLEVFANSLNLGKKPAPKFILNKIDLEMFKFSFLYSDLNLPDIYEISSIDYATGNIKVSVKPKVEELTLFAKENLDKLLSQAQESAVQSTSPMATFLDKIISEDVFSNERMSEIVNDLLMDEELINSCIAFVNVDTQKYGVQFNKYLAGINEWLAPLQSVHYYDSIDNTVNALVYNEDLENLMSWFIPMNLVKEYEDTVVEYYDTYVLANDLYTDTSKYIAEGKYDKAVENILYNKNTSVVLNKFFDEKEVASYIASGNEYFDTYKQANQLLAVTNNAISQNDYAIALENVLYNRNTTSLLQQIMPRTTANQIISNAKNYYELYEKTEKDLAENLEKIDLVQLNNLFEEISFQIEHVEENQDVLITQVSNIDTASIQNMFNQFSQTNEGQNLLTMLDEEFVSNLNQSVNLLNDYQQLLINAIENLDTKKISSANICLDEIESFIQSSVSNLQEKNYTEFINAITNYENSFENTLKIIESI